MELVLLLIFTQRNGRVLYLAQVVVYIDSNAFLGESFNDALDFFDFRLLLRDPSDNKDDVDESQDFKTNMVVQVRQVQKLKKKENESSQILFETTNWNKINKFVFPQMSNVSMAPCIISC